MGSIDIATIELDKLCDLAQGLARQAGALTKQLRDQPNFAVDDKTSASDLVTNADKAAEKLIVEGLEAARPDDGLVGEEGASKLSTSGITWHIDPIDGTTNFVYNMTYGVSIGAAVDDTLIASCVYFPKSDEMFAATLGGGATLNGKKIEVNKVDDPKLALIATGISANEELRMNQPKIIAKMVPQIRDMRRTGAATIDFCFVACGRLDGYYESGLNSWDQAAGQLIATEAGAKSTPFVPDMLTEHKIPIVVSATGIFDWLCKASESI